MRRFRVIVFVKRARRGCRTEHLKTSQRDLRGQLLCRRTWAYCSMGGGGGCVQNLDRRDDLHSWTTAPSLGREEVKMKQNRNGLKPNSPPAAWLCSGSPQVSGVRSRRRYCVGTSVRPLRYGFSWSPGRDLSAPASRVCALSFPSIRKPSTLCWGAPWCPGPPDVL